MHPAVHPSESTAAVVVDIPADHGMARADLVPVPGYGNEIVTLDEPKRTVFACSPCSGAGTERPCPGTRLWNVAVTGCPQRGSLVAAEPLAGEVVGDDAGGGEVAVDGPGGGEQAREEGCSEGFQRPAARVERGVDGGDHAA